MLRLPHLPLCLTQIVTKSGGSRRDRDGRPRQETETRDSDHYLTLGNICDSSRVRQRQETETRDRRQRDGRCSGPVVSSVALVKAHAFRLGMPECKKWKLIRDSYNRYKRKQKQSTGSAAPAKNSKWQFYERLRFLENTPSERQSCTSVEQEQQSSASVEKEVTNTSPGVKHADTPHEAADTSVHNTPSKELPGTSQSTQEKSNIPSNSSAKNTKRKRPKDEFIKFMKDRQENRNRQLESLKSQESVDDISTFIKHIEMMLRKLNARSRAMAKTEIFNIVSKQSTEIELYKSVAKIQVELNRCKKAKAGLVQMLKISRKLTRSEAYKMVTKNLSSAAKTFFDMQIKQYTKHP
ncbi:hypothetical protein PYW08_006477 [Mythimna loreyi]|uniref:Uncharacterized protein n=1 Tax=Mythimna loreyi TaxID=667449 RepID=A0ACC2QQ98_9NEOP|nr:hypothetical protein PYW08_006477 [Mythimna loreyi]